MSSPLIPSPRWRTSLLALPVLCCVTAPAALAQVEHLWHIPESYSEVPWNIPMRDPVAPQASQETTFYQGVWRNGGANNQSGGKLLYRYGTTGVWQSADLSFHADSGDNQFWKATVNAGPDRVPMQYYFEVTFNEQSTTFLHNNNSKTLDEATAQDAPYSVIPTMALRVETPTTGELNADYTTTKIYADEVAGTSVPVTITLVTGAANAVEAEVWTNLNNRDRATGDADNDGIHDGILGPPAPTEKPPNHQGGPYPENGYFQAIPMTAAGNGTFSLQLAASKTGAYRLTARYRLDGESEWRWYNSDGRRDHCITVSPVQARDIRMYELNIFNIESAGKDFALRSTIEDLTDEPNALHTHPSRPNKFNLDYLRELGVNWIWFQPYHPYGWEGRHLSALNIRDRDESQQEANTLVWDGSGYVEDVDYAYELGSPYAKKNFWEVEPRMSAAFSGDPGNYDDVTSSSNRSAAMAAFQNFMAKADEAGVNLMPDAAFNHSAWDVELGQAGLDYIMSAVDGASGWSASDLIHDREVRFFSRRNDYAQRATYYNNFFDNDIAPAPDRGDFAKWLDVVDIFFGRYAALVSRNPDDNGNRTNEQDWFDYTTATGNFDAITRGVWQYFARYAPYWLEKGRPPGQARNSTPQDGDAAFRYAWDARGIDGLRCDFGQGLPPQAWEYIINVARSVKWSFVFMSESLDGGAVTYRSNRHFDILNESIFNKAKTTSTASAYRAMFEERRTAYDQGLVLLNTVSHDEDNYDDPWQAFIRYAVFGTIDGAPMVFPGQELGISRLWGYDLYEINFGKPVPHFKTYNSMMMAWGNNDFGLRQLRPAYSAINVARSISPALRSSNRRFLDPVGANESIFAVAKYETEGVSAAAQDVVLAFANLDRNASPDDTFGIPPELADDLGLFPERTYNVKNIAAYIGEQGLLTERLGWLWPGGKTGQVIVDNGVYVSLNAVPSTDGEWQDTPFEAQYLKVYDVTPMPALIAAPQVTYSYTVDGSVGLSWSGVTDDEGLTPTYRVSVFDEDGTEVNAIETSSTSAVIDDLPAGQSYTFRVTPLNPNDPKQEAVSTAAATDPSPASTAVQSLDPAGDFDGDGQRNAAEAAAGTDPLSAASVFRATVGRDGDDVVINWTPVPDKTYAVRRRSSLTEGSWLSVATGLTNGVHREAVGEGQRFYQVVVEAPAP